MSYYQNRQNSRLSLNITEIFSKDHNKNLTIEHNKLFTASIQIPKFFLVLRIDINDFLGLEEEHFFPNNIIIAQNINMYTKIIIIIIVKIEYNQTVDRVLINNSIFWINKF